MKIRDLFFSFAGTIIRVAILIIAAFIVIQAGKKAYDFGYRIFTEEPMSAAPGRDVTVTVTSGDSESDIAKMLEEKGLIRDALLFRIQKKLSIYKKAVAPGSYELNTSMNTEEMLEALVGPVDSDGSEDTDDTEGDGVDALDPSVDDMTGLETGGVLAEEEGNYDEGAAFVEEDESAEDAEGEEGAEESESEE